MYVWVGAHAWGCHGDQMKAWDALDLELQALGSFSTECWNLDPLQGQ